MGAVLPTTRSSQPRNSVMINSANALLTAVAQHQRPKSSMSKDKQCFDQKKLTLEIAITSYEKHPRKLGKLDLSQFRKFIEGKGI